jgi:glycosyltransferase involved in cell wall biosynthesis
MFAGLPAGLRSELKLVVVCRLDDEIAQTWRSLAHELGLHGDQLVLTGLIDDARLRDLYRQCEVFVEPSQFEGFGLPLAEAAACGAVAICSNTSSLPEVIPTSENLFDPTDLRAATALLEDALTKSQLRTRLREAAHQSQQTHRWDAVADRALTILAAMAREVEVPQASLADYLRRGFPVGAIGRTIPQACIDD